MCGGSMGTKGTRWGQCGRGGDAVVAVLDSGVQPKLTGAHGPERPKAAYGRIIALNSADSTLSSESPGARPGWGGLHRPPTPFKGGWAGWASPQSHPQGAHVAGLVSHVWGLHVPRSQFCTRDTTRMSPLCPLLSPQPGEQPSSGSARRMGTWHGWLSPCGDTFRMGLKRGSRDGEG